MRAIVLFSLLNDAICNHKPCFIDYFYLRKQIQIKMIRLWLLNERKCNGTTFLCSSMYLQDFGGQICLGVSKALVFRVSYCDLQDCCVLSACWLGSCLFWGVDPTGWLCLTPLADPSPWSRWHSWKALALVGYMAWTSKAVFALFNHCVS